MRCPPARRRESAGRAEPTAVDHPDDLVTRNRARPVRLEIALGQVQVGAAHAARVDTHTDLVRTGLGIDALSEHQRSIVDRSGSPDPPRFHGGA